MEPHAPLFPSFAAPLSDLYGASSFRAAEAHASALDLDELDRAELALEHTVRALVDRPAPPPIGLKFHRAAGAVAAGSQHSYLNSSAGSTANAPDATPTQRLQRGGVAPVGTEGSRLGSGVQTTRGYHGAVAEDEDEEEDEEDDMEEDEMEELDDEEEEEEEDDDELFAGERDPDDAGSDSMDMSM